MKRSLPISCSLWPVWTYSESAANNAAWECQAQLSQEIADFKPAMPSYKQPPAKLPGWFIKNGYELRFGKVVRKSNLSILFYNEPSVRYEDDCHPLRDIWPIILSKVCSLNFVDQWRLGRVHYFQAKEIGCFDTVFEKFRYVNSSGVNFIFGGWTTFMKQVQEMRLGYNTQLICTFFDPTNKLVTKWYHYNMDNH